MSAILLRKLCPSKKHFAELDLQHGGKTADIDMIWRNYVTVTLCIIDVPRLCAQIIWLHLPVFRGGKRERTGDDEKGGAATRHCSCSIVWLTQRWADPVSCFSHGRNYLGLRAGSGPPKIWMDHPNFLDEECDYRYVTHCSARNWVYHPYFVLYNNLDQGIGPPTLKTWLRPWSQRYLLYVIEIYRM